MFALYGIVAFVTTLAAPLASIWKAQAHTNAVAMLGNLMNYLAYLLMGIPAGRILSRAGYKRTALIGCGTGAVGLAVQWASGAAGGVLGIYLAGALISGLALCLLNVVINPLLNTLGGGGAGGNRLNMLGGTFNSLCGALTPLLVGMLIGTVTKETRLADVNIVLYIAFAVFVLTFIVLACLPLPERLHSAASTKCASPLSVPHCRWGIVGIFLFMGTSIGIAGTLNLWLISLGHTAATGGAYFSAYVFLMLVGRICGSIFAQHIPVRKLLAAASTAALCLIIIAVCVTQVMVTIGGATVPLSVPILVLCGLCTSVMWSSIFALSVEGLGAATEAASGWFMTMVVGGGIIPLFQNFLADKIGYVPSYIVPATVFCYLIVYALKLSERKQL